MGNPFTLLRVSFGPHGERWSSLGPMGPHGESCLAVGLRRSCAALEQYVPHGTVYTDARALIYRVLEAKGIRYSMSSWNDSPTTEWSDIRWLVDECESQWELTHD